MKIEPEPHELLENTLPKKKGQVKINSKKLGGGSGAYDSMMVEDSKVHEISSRGQHQRQ